jgi:hypothetical protein
LGAQLPDQAAVYWRVLGKGHRRRPAIGPG